jgi:hypothetical protein
MKILSAFKHHGYIDLDPSIVTEAIAYPWDAVKKSYDGDPLLPSNNLYVMIEDSPNINLPQGTTRGPLTDHLSSMVAQLKNIFVDQICLRAMVINLPANTAQHWHVDPRMLHELAHRVHVALYTNPDSVIEVEQYEQHFAVGEVWEFNNLLPHRANNRGTSNRIHLITDWMPLETYETQQTKLHQVRPDISNNLGKLYQSLAGKCVFSPEKP